MSQYMVHEIIDAAKEPDWPLVNRFLMICGEAHDPRKFAAAILSGASEFCSFDRALVFFIDGNGKVSDDHLHNFARENINDYLSTYGYEKDAVFSLAQEHRETPDLADMVLIGWHDEPNTDFIRNYVRPQGLSWSLCMVFYDLYGNFRTVIALDRFSKTRFSEREMRQLFCAMPHLNNLHKNFFYNAEKKGAGIHTFSSENSVLTRREAEIANLLCEGVSPANVSKSLYISKATTYKHISNIYEKLGISSQRELLALMLSQ